MYVISDDQQKRIDSRFDHRTLKGEAEEGYDMLVNQARMLALTLAATCPLGRELELALEKLEESMMWANAAITRTEAVLRRS